MITSIVELLRDHVGHRTTLVEPGGTGLSLKCLDCTRLLDLSNALGLRPSSLKPTSTSPDIPRLGDPDTCPRHPGEWARSCARCRSEDLERRPEDVPLSQVRTGTDPTRLEAWQAAREAVRAAQQRARQQPDMSPPESTVDSTAADGGSP